MKPNSERLLSLDFFRGFTVAAMILVNNPGSWGSIYAPLQHANWHGCTPTDLIFPFFLFIVGVSIVFAMNNKKSEPSLHNQTLKTALSRGLKLIGLGLFLSMFPKIFTNPIETLENLRFMGVLQRIGIVFFIAAFIFLKCTTKNIFKIFIGILIVYWLLMTFVPVPNIGYANLEKETNLGAWIDRTLFSEAHLWKNAKTWDPEGLLSTLPALATGLLGVLTGIYLKNKEQKDEVKVAWLFSMGLIAVLSGLIWDLQFPINKSLWTSSFVLYTGGLGILTFTLCYWLIDIQGYKKYTKPFVVYGVNAITVFFMSAIIVKTLAFIKLKDNTISAATFLYETGFSPYFSPINASLAWALAWVIFWLGILWVMYKKNIFIKV